MRNHINALRSNREQGEVLNVLLIGVLVITVLGIVAAIVFAIIAAVNTPSTGIIAAKEYHEPYTSESCTTVNKSIICTPIYHGPEWSVDLKNAKEHKEGWVDVSEHTYDTKQVGDYYDTKEG